MFAIICIHSVLYFQYIKSRDLAPCPIYRLKQLLRRTPRLLQNYSFQHQQINIMNWRGSWLAFGQFLHKFCRNLNPASCICSFQSFFFPQNFSSRARFKSELRSELENPTISTPPLRTLPSNKQQQCHMPASKKYLTAIPQKATLVTSPMTLTSGKS